MLAVGIGIAAGAVSLVDGPFATVWSAVVASALGLLALADAARSASGLASSAAK